MKILFLDSAHLFLKQELERQGHVCEEDFFSSKAEIEAKLSNYDGVVLRSRIIIDKIFIDRLVSIPSPIGRVRVGQFIARVGAGMEHIDVAYAESKGVKCISSPEGNRNAVAEHALGMLLSLLNNISKANAEVKAGEWKREANRGTELEGKIVGIIGYGNTGSAFAKVLSGLGVKMLAYDNDPSLTLPEGKGNVEIVSLKEIFEKADVVSLHLPLTEETNYLVDDTFINKFKKNICLINTSRGPIVKTADLVKNLKSRKVLGACLDVIEYEETSFEAVDSTTKNQELTTNSDWKYLKESQNVILTPHIAGWSFQSSEKMARILVEKIAELCK